MFDRLFRRSDLSNVELLLLSKEDCHLCDEALEVIESVRRRHPFRLRVVKIAEGDEWYDRFWDKIPVGLVEGRMIFKYRVQSAELLEKLRARRA
jgi:Glutaredoxin-like domain (DUF836)